VIITDLLYNQGANFSEEQARQVLEILRDDEESALNGEPGSAMLRQIRSRLNEVADIVNYRDELYPRFNNLLNQHNLDEVIDNLTVSFPEWLVSNFIGRFDPDLEALYMRLCQAHHAMLGAYDLLDQNDENAQAIVSDDEVSNSSFRP
jgi:hypothetical protein